MAKLVSMSTVSGEVSGKNNGRYPLHHFSCLPESADAVLPPLLTIEFTGGDEWIEGCYRQRINSSIYSVELIREGSLYYTQDSKRTLAKPGDVIIIRRGAVNEMETGPDGFCFKQVMCISGEMLEHLFSRGNLLDVNIVRLKEPDIVYNLMLEAKESLEERKQGYQIKNSITVFSILQILASEAEGSVYPAVFKKALEVLDLSISQGITLKQLGRTVGASTPTLCRLFRKYLDTTPLEYFLKLRIGFASSLLRNTALSIKEIAAKCGYVNQLYFSSQFRRRMGVSPREYRRKIQLTGKK